jgi:hypothetical protein
LGDFIENWYEERSQYQICTCPSIFEEAMALGVSFV